MSLENGFYTSTVCDGSEKVASCVVFIALILLTYVVTVKMTNIPSAIGLSAVVLFALLPIWELVKIFINQFFGKELIIFSDKLVYNSKTYEYNTINELNSDNKIVKFYCNNHDEDVVLCLNNKDAYKLTNSIELFKA